MTWTSEEIYELRQRLGDTQADFAKRVGIPTYEGSAPRIADLEAGRREPSGPLCKLLDLIEEEVDA